MVMQNIYQIQHILSILACTLSIHLCKVRHTSCAYTSTANIHLWEWIKRPFQAQCNIALKSSAWKECQHASFESKEDFSIGLWTGDQWIVFLHFHFHQAVNRFFHLHWRLIGFSICMDLSTGGGSVSQRWETIERTSLVNHSLKS